VPARAGWRRGSSFDFVKLDAGSPLPLSHAGGRFFAVALLFVAAVFGGDNAPLAVKRSEPH
jgi:hypothetical protein